MTIKDNATKDDLAGLHAFPFVATIPTGTVVSVGMSLRDWFAGQALAGLVQLRAIHEAARESGEPAETITAKAAYAYADAMMAARNSTPTKQGD